jgi:23S rRNA (adenine2503-C2)-methyltransferase
MPANRRVLFQYALFHGYNDSLADAAMLARLVAPVRCRVNIIPANPGPDPTLVAPSTEDVDAFVEALAERGITTLVRRPRGRDVGGACGQLAGSARSRVSDETNHGAACP